MIQKIKQFKQDFISRAKSEQNYNFTKKNYKISCNKSLLHYIYIVLQFRLFYLLHSVATISLTKRFSFFLQNKQK